MTPVFAGRRRAEEFAALVDDPDRGGQERYTQLLDLVAAMRETPAPQARPEFVADLRARLMAEAETALTPVDTDRLTLPPRRPARERRIAAVVGGVALVGATTSMAMASQSALPGDALYPVKRAIEDVHTGLSVGEGSKGSTLLSNAEGRLDEVSQLTEGGDLGDNLAIADTLNDFTDQSVEASDLLMADYAQHGNQSSIEELHDFTGDSLDELTDLESKVPAEARDELIHAAQVVVAIDSAAQQACPTCGGAGITHIPPMFTPTAATPLDTQPAHPVTGPRGHHHHRGGQDSSTDVQLPTVGQDGLPPGSVLQPTPGPGGQGTPSPDDLLNDPIGSLTQGLTGGDEPTSNPSLPDVGGTVHDVTGGVGDLLDGTTDTVTGGLN